MEGLAVCAGVGGLELGLQIVIPEYRCIAAIEHNAGAALRFRRRFPEARVFEEVVGFDGRPFHGLVDCISAGFPCQPHSVAGNRGGTRDERWVWPEIARIIGEVHPGIVFLENVAGLLHDADSDSPQGDLEESPDESMGGMGSVLRDLAQMGFVAAWGSVRASDVGASHIRERVFILADTTIAHRRCGIPREETRTGQNEIGWVGSASGDRTLAVTDLARLPRYQPEAIPATQADPQGRATAQLRQALLETFAPGPLDPAWNSILRSSPDLAPSLSPITAALARAVSLEKSGIDLHEEIESGFHRLADGVARWLVERRKRLRFAGNGVVPLQAALAFALLCRKLQLTTH